MKISIITPCFNAENYIGDTIRSVLSQTAVQSGRVELEYLVCDGKSKDRTVEIARSFNCDRISIISEPDRGMYDAVGKGLRQVTGDVVAYINAGDYYHPMAFEIIADIFSQTDTRWLTGFISGCDDRGTIWSVRLPFRYRGSLVRSGFYGRKLPFVQQESTFWRRELHDLIDYERLASFRLAGDFYLWHRFSTAHTLRIVAALLGVFRLHPGQLSENVNAYFEEMNSIADRISITDHIFGAYERLLWNMPPKYMKRYNAKGLYMYDWKKGIWI